MFCANCVGDFKGLQSRQFSSVPFNHAWNMRPKFGVEDQLKAYKDYKIHFARHGIRLPSLQTRFDYHALVLLNKMRSSLVPPYLCALLPWQVSATTGYSFRKSGYPVPATRKSSTLASFVPRSIDSPLERTYEGNSRVQHVDQVQNQIKNPLTYLMSTVASFKTPDDLLYCLLSGVFLYKQCTSSLPLFQSNTNKQTIVC